MIIWLWLLSQRANLNSIFRTRKDIFFLHMNHLFIMFNIYNFSKFPLGSKILILAGQTSRINNYNWDQCRCNQLEKDLKVFDFYICYSTHN